MIEILILNLRPGTRDEFHELYVKESLPLQKKWNIEVVAHGPSLHDDNSYYVVRSFKNLDDRERLQNAFYNSDDWQKGPRTAILSKAEHMATVVVSDEAVQQLIGSANLEKAM
jgi:NIPSNAP protein